MVVCLFDAGASAQSIEPFTVRIQQTSADLGQTLRLDVTLEVGYVNISGFDFLLAYDNRALTLTDLFPGDLSAECDWEYFQWQAGPCEPLAAWDPATDTIRVRAFAVRDGSDHVPLCYMVNRRPFPLFSMAYRATNDRTWDGAESPVRFRWYGCTDNAVIVPASLGPTPHNSVTTVAQSIFEPSGWEMADPHAGLPGYQGPSEECVTYERNSPVPFINLINGAVGLGRRQSAPHSWGDMNLNGMIAEIEDSWLMAKCLLYGDSVLSIQRDAQLAAGDVDRDGRSLTIADLALLMRIVTGDYTPAIDAPPAPERAFPDDPFHSPPPAAARATVRRENRSLTVTANDSLVAAHLVFEGSIRPIVIDENLDVTFFFDGQLTRVLIHGFFTGARIAEGPFFRWEGSGRLRDISLATVTGGLVATTLE